MNFIDELPLTKVWPFCLYKHPEATITDALKKNLTGSNGEIDQEKLLSLLAQMIKVHVKTAIMASDQPFYV